jgi:hypothetical protein
MDNKNHVRIDISKDFSQVKYWFSVLISVSASVLMNRLQDRQVDIVPQIAVESGFSGHLYISRRYYLFLGCFYSFMYGQSRASLLATAASRMPRSNVQPSSHSGI